MPRSNNIYWIWLCWCLLIKHINEDIPLIIYFDPSKYLVKDGYDGDRYSLLCNDIATTAIKEGFHIIRNGYYNIRGSTAQRFSCNRCVLYKGDVKHCNSESYRLKSFHHSKPLTKIASVLTLNHHTLYVLKCCAIERIKK